MAEAEGLPLVVEMVAALVAVVVIPLEVEGSLTTATGQHETVASTAAAAPTGATTVAVTKIPAMPDKCHHRDSTELRLTRAS